VFVPLEGKSKREDSIRDVFLGVIDSIWSLLAARYTDNDSWLDLKYLGTSIVEALANLELPPTTDMPKNISDEHIYETLSNLKKGEEFHYEKKADLLNSKLRSFFHSGPKIEKKVKKAHLSWLLWSKISSFEQIKAILVNLKVTNNSY
jgi:hypothetical protein